MTLDFSEFEEGDEIIINYTIYDSLVHDNGPEETNIATEVEEIVSNNLRWKAGSTGIGVVQSSGHVFDGNGMKIGIDATVSHLD